MSSNVHGWSEWLKSICALVNSSLIILPAVVKQTSLHVKPHPTIIVTPQTVINDKIP